MLVCFTIGLSACSGQVDEATLNQRWAGRPVEDMIRKLGAPTRTSTDRQSSQQVMTWDRDTSFQYNATVGGGQSLVGMAPGGTGAASIPIFQNNASSTERRTMTQTCRIQVTVDAQRRIVNLSRSNPDVLRNSATAGAAGAVPVGLAGSWRGAAVAAGLTGGGQLSQEMRTDTCKDVDLNPPS